MGQLNNPLGSLLNGQSAGGLPELNIQQQLLQNKVNKRIKGPYIVRLNCNIKVSKSKDRFFEEDT